jgi:hypothetical protein
VTAKKIARLGRGGCRYFTAWGFVWGRLQRLEPVGEAHMSHRAAMHRTTKTSSRDVPIAPDCGAASELGIREACEDPVAGDVV